jgi:hypothetical protein
VLTAIDRVLAAVQPDPASIASALVGTRFD